MECWIRCKKARWQYQKFKTHFIKMKRCGWSENSLCVRAHSSFFHSYIRHELQTTLIRMHDTMCHHAPFINCLLCFDKIHRRSLIEKFIETSGLKDIFITNVFLSLSLSFILARARSLFRILMSLILWPFAYFLMA